jgi:hypothetical protein
MKTHFETVVCSRCHGSGEYSFCTDYGSRCFRCHGSGRVHTKRGSAALNYLERICTVPASEVRVGDRVPYHGITNGGKAFTAIGTVAAITARTGTRTRTVARHFSGSYIHSTETRFDGKFSSSGSTTESTGVEGSVTEPYTEYTLHITSKYGDTNHVIESVRVYRDDNQAKIQQALEYQATLTKLGTPIKRKKAQAVA